MYEFDAIEKPKLDRAEGLGYGYLEQQVKCQVGDTQYLCFTYIASIDALRSDMQPYTWYRDLVIAGAEFQGFPSDYVEELKRLETLSDPNSDRASENAELLERLLTHTRV